MGDAKDRGGDKMLSGWPRILLGRGASDFQILKRAH